MEEGGDLTFGVGLIVGIVVVCSGGVVGGGSRTFRSIAFSGRGGGRVGGMNGCRTW